MTNCNQEWIEFPAVKRRKVQAAFSGGDITSDGGALLLRDMDRRLGLLESVNRVLHDPRDSDRVVHSQLSLLRQRIYGLCLGYEDLNDHQELRLCRVPCDYIPKRSYLLFRTRQILNDWLTQNLEEA